MMEMISWYTCINIVTSLAVTKSDIRNIDKTPNLNISLSLKFHENACEYFIVLFEKLTVRL